MTILINGPVGLLEVAENPAPPTSTIMTTAIICHPHPLYGGSMTNKVVTTLGRAFENLGATTIRFNYRGVGKSEGKYDNAVGEIQDLLAIIQYAKQKYPNNKFWLAGFSFGTYIAFMAALDIIPEKLILVAPSVEHFKFPLPPALSFPLLVVQGEKDEVVNPESVYKFVAELSPPPTLIKFPEASHFFHGQLQALRLAVENYLHL